MNIFETLLTNENDWWKFFFNDLLFQINKIKLLEYFFSFLKLFFKFNVIFCWKVFLLGQNLTLKSISEVQWT